MACDMILICILVGFNGIIKGLGGPVWLLKTLDRRGKPGLIFTAIFKKKNFR
jgi:Na+/H+ antiporter NhaC